MKYKKYILKKTLISVIFVCTLLLSATLTPATDKLKTEESSPIDRIDTSIDKITPYNTPSSPITITATGANDLDEVSLYYRWSKDNITWGDNAVKYETGIIENVNGWTTVDLDNIYTYPVVIVTGQEGADISLSVEKSRPRIRDISSNNFEVIVTNDVGTSEIVISK